MQYKSKTEVRWGCMVMFGVEAEKASQRIRRLSYALGAGIVPFCTVPPDDHIRVVDGPTRVNIQKG
jgi:hypothetical protein